MLQELVRLDFRKTQIGDVSGWISYYTAYAAGGFQPRERPLDATLMSLRAPDQEGRSDLGVLGWSMKFLNNFLSN